MKNYLQVANTSQSFLRFSAFRLILFTGLCVIFIVLCVLGQKLVYFYGGTGNTYVYKNGSLGVHFLDVGHGDCTIVQLPDGKIAVIDGGEDGDYSYYNRVKEYLDKRIKPKKNKIDYLISTHPHEDHLGGLIRIANDFRVGIVYRPDIVYPDEALTAFARARKTEFITEGLSFGNKHYRIQFHATTVSELDDNESSPIITIEYGAQVFIITGDAGHITETAFESSETGKAIFGNGRAEKLKTWLQVGHHGSDGSSHLPFLRFVKPDIAIISVGTRFTRLPNELAVNRLETYDEQTQRGAQVLLTRTKGHIAVLCNGDKTKMFFAFDNPKDLTLIWVIVFFSIIIFCFVNQNRIKKV